MHFSWLVWDGGSILASHLITVSLPPPSSIPLEWVPSSSSSDHNPRLRLPLLPRPRSEIAPAEGEKENPFLEFWERASRGNVERGREKRVPLLFSEIGGCVMTMRTTISQQMTTAGYEGESPRSQGNANLPAPSSGLESSAPLLSAVIHQDFFSLVVGWKSTSNYPGRSYFIFERNPFKAKSIKTIT